MGLFVVSSIQRSKGTASSTPVWNQYPQVQTAFLILAAACSLMRTPVTQTWMWSNLLGPIHCKYGRTLSASHWPWITHSARMSPVQPDWVIVPWPWFQPSPELGTWWICCRFFFGIITRKKSLCFLALLCDALSCWDGFGDGCCLCWLLGNVHCYFYVCFHTEQSMWSNPSGLLLSNCSVIMTSCWRL